MTESQWLNWPMAQTGIQSHATCQGVVALNTEANILEVQSNETDPFWNYVPFQRPRQASATSRSSGSPSSTRRPA